MLEISRSSHAYIHCLPAAWPLLNLACSSNLTILLHVTAKVTSNKTVSRRHYAGVASIRIMAGAPSTTNYHFTARWAQAAQRKTAVCSMIDWGVMAGVTPVIRRFTTQQQAPFTINRTMAHLLTVTTKGLTFTTMAQQVCSHVSITLAAQSPLSTSPTVQARSPILTNLSRPCHPKELPTTTTVTAIMPQTLNSSQMRPYTIR